MPNSTVKLNPVENVLIGKYISGDRVMVECDAENEGFSFNMPDGRSALQTTFKLVKTDQTGNKIEIGVSVAGDKIMNETSQELRRDSDMLILTSNEDGHYR